MTLGRRKLAVLAAVGLVFLLANALVVASWLKEHGVIDSAGLVRREFLTGTAITIILVLVILLVPARQTGAALARHCPVCDHALRDAGSYCSECGSRL